MQRCLVSTRHDLVNLRLHEKVMSATIVMELFDRILKAPEFPKDFKWLNTKEPLSLEKLKGHVVVLDFWTYCCINCMHILPDLECIEKKYSDKPVIVIGVHSAKFEEETDPKNIEQAILRYEIKHPVIVDQKMQIWKNYRAQGWPTLAVIDPEGRIVYMQSGEGQKEILVELIDTLLEAAEGKLAKGKINIQRPLFANKSILSYPGKMSFSPDRKRFVISDSNNNRILIVKKGGKIETIIGSGKKGMEGGDFSKATFNRPQGVFWSDEEVYVADTENHALRLIDLNKGTVNTVAGTGKQAMLPSQGGSGKETGLSSPWDLAGRNGLLYIAMAGLHQIWIYDPKSTHIRPFAGNSRENIIDGPLSAAEFAQPSGITVLDNQIYVADSEVSGIREINIMGNNVSTIAGSGLFDFGFEDGNVNHALFQHPLGLTGNNSTLYVADTYNNAIRKIDLEKGIVSTLIHKKEGLCMIGDNIGRNRAADLFPAEACDVLGLWEPSDIKYVDGVLYIVDTNNHLIRTFDLKTKKLETLELRI